MLRPMPIEPVPPETARVARAVFPQGNRYLRLADELDTLFTDEAFGALFPTHGQPACPPWRLALVTPPIRRGALRPPSGACRTQSHRLEICATPGAYGPWVRCLRAQRVSRPSAGRVGGVSVVRDLTRVEPRPPADQREGPQESP
jgi:hypothetical protein